MIIWYKLRETCVMERTTIICSMTLTVLFFFIYFIIQSKTGPMQPPASNPTPPTTQSSIPNSNIPQNPSSNAPSVSSTVKESKKEQLLSGYTESDKKEIKSFMEETMKKYTGQIDSMFEKHLTSFQEKQNKQNGRYCFFIV